jgi:hypothetical protein
MKNVTLPIRIGSFESWVQECFTEIERAAAEDIENAVGDFTLTGTLTERRTINAGTATLAELRDFVCTLVNDIQKQGQKRSL